MSTPTKPGADKSAQGLLERVRAATDLLESLAADWSQLETLPKTDRHRLHVAVARLHDPDPVARRRRVEIEKRRQRAAAAARDEAVLNQTGWNRKQAAKLLGVSYKTLLQKIRECNLEAGD